VRDQWVPMLRGEGPTILSQAGQGMAAGGK